MTKPDSAIAAWNPLAPPTRRPLDPAEAAAVAAQRASVRLQQAAEHADADRLHAVVRQIGVDLITELDRKESPDMNGITAPLTTGHRAPSTTPTQIAADRLLVRALIDNDSSVLDSLDAELLQAVTHRLRDLQAQAQRQAWRHPAPQPIEYDDDASDEPNTLAPPSDQIIALGSDQQS